MKRAALVLAFCPALALAAPPTGADPNSPVGQWFKSLVQPNGQSCCSAADCRETAVAPDGNGGLLAWLPQLGWIAVPPDRIQRREDNPTGHAVVCSVGHSILCAVLATGL